MLNEFNNHVASTLQSLAIVGMSCRLPNADNSDLFWDLMASGNSGVGELPPDRLNRRLYYSNEKGQQSKTFSTISGLVPPRASDPSPDFRSMNSKELNFDPCHEILCGVVDQARLNAGWSIENLSKHRTGVYVGHSSGSSLGGELVLGSMIPEVVDRFKDITAFASLEESERNEILAELVQRIQHQRPVRNDGQPQLDANLAARLIASRFQLDGPQMVIDAACASSLFALVLANAALTQGEIEQAIVSGASYSKTESLILFSQAQSCSSTGSRPFDAKADGLVNAEGYVVVLIKTLARAQADGDRIQGIIRGIGVSSDGRGRSLWAPRKEGQLTAVRRAYGGDVTPQSVQYLEAHATSTQVGDATELEALSEFFSHSKREGKLPIGSVKSNIGHTLEAAGLASLLKCVLSMQRGLIPATINLVDPNPRIDWEKSPFRPVTGLTQWPDAEGHPRRAALNAFGIGGLNVHVVVDGPPVVTETVARNGISHNTFLNGDGFPDIKFSGQSDRSMAIVGRGVVVAGAFDLDSFRRLLKSGESQLTSPPPERWRNTLLWETRPIIRDTFETARGGYIRGYQYDWRKHKIPPLQLKNANPLQFMLLDAAQQALDESGFGTGPFDRQRSAVVVGATFGGEFSHQLQVGLRLPEILDEMTTTLQGRHWDEPRIRKMCELVESQILTDYPAIKDETGSFTCSTHASRIAKTLNVMGGAMAIDAADCSGLAALQAAQHLLACNIVDFVFCAAAQRDLDAVGFEAWSWRSSELLKGEGTAQEVAPGEGVVLLLLRRLAEARRDQNKIFGVIHDVHASASQSMSSKNVCESATDMKPEANAGVRTPDSSALTRQFGHLQAASGLFEILGSTVERELDQSRDRISAVQTATTECCFRAVCETVTPEICENTQARHSTISTPSIPTTSNGNSVSNAMPIDDRQALKSTSSANGRRIDAVRSSTSRPATRIVRVWGSDQTELRRQIVGLIESNDFLYGNHSTEIPSHAPFRLAIVASREDLQKHLELALGAIDTGHSSHRLQEQGIYYGTPHFRKTARLAAMFPGQGSQRARMLVDLIAASAAAQQTLQRADEALIRFGAAPCSAWITGDASFPASDLQATQIAMLTVDLCALSVTNEWGLQPDFVVGHSFGEYAALVSSEAMEFESAFAIMLARAKAVAACVHGHGAMLSLGASLTDVREVIGDLNDIFVTHCNAPRQTVVSGTMSGIAELARRTKERGIASVSIPVSSPFHTPLLQPARAVLEIALSQHRWRPPRIPLLSSVSGRFVADRQEIMENLSRQLTEPVHWINNVERLLAEDVRVFVEIGPGRVLTKISQQIIDKRNAFVIAIDTSDLQLVERKQRIQAAMEAAGVPLKGFGKISGFTDSSDRLNVQLTPKIREPLQPVAKERPVDLFRVPSIGNEQSTGGFAAKSDPSTATKSLDPLSQFLIDIVVEQTGYPADVIEMDWELETDLGIDSIRKVQILGQLKEYFEPNLELEPEQFNELRTLNEIRDFLKQTSGKAEWLLSSEALAASPIPGEHNEFIDHNSSETAQGPMLARSLITERGSETDVSIDDFLIDFVVERTGYPRDIIELDADLEADLGIDSIAKAQLIGEVFDHYSLLITDSMDRTALIDIRTLREVREMIKSNLGISTLSGAVPKPDPVPAPISIPDDFGSGDTLERSDEFQIATHDHSIVAPSRSLSSAPASFSPPLASIEFERGRSWGVKHRQRLHHRLFDFADRLGKNGDHVGQQVDQCDRNDFTIAEEAELHGIAEGAHVSHEQILLIRDTFALPIQEFECAVDLNGEISDRLDHGDDFRSMKKVELVASPVVTQRFRLAMSEPEVRTSTGKIPEFSGGAIVVGNNPESEELVQRLKSFGVAVTALRVLGTREETFATLDSLWASNPSPHLFILTPRDAAAQSTLDESQWKRRRECGITSVYWLCQRWLRLVEQSKLLDDASLVGVTALGGDFGISGHIASTESGALTGLFKSIIIECWTSGCRTTPIKLLDMPTDSHVKTVVDAICFELAEPSYDVEIGWNADKRSVLRSIPEQITKHLPSKLTPTGNWIVTGGARGITAYVVGRMAARFPGAHFHLVGTAPCPSFSADERIAAKTTTAVLRADVMRNARKAGQNPLEAWKNKEKAIEIDRSLAEFQAAGIRVTYHSCDVSDRTTMSEMLENIRKEFGPLRGVIHAAGIGKDARFQRKEPDKVEQCLAAKIDGTLNLIALTQNDPLQAFLAFGSISGRFGANGHTDYSMANDMLAKLVRWHRQLRAAVPATVFHWHAWDDVGMATKPETRLALESIGMQFMPASEGAAHFLSEIEAGLPITEVLITDTQYFKMFYPADRILTGTVNRLREIDAGDEWPLIRRTELANDDCVQFEVLLNPVIDPFLKEHRLNDRPLLPMVIMAELLMEGASFTKDGLRPFALHDLQIFNSVKFATDAPIDARVACTPSTDESVAVELVADVRSRNGTLLAADRLCAKTVVDFSHSLDNLSLKERLERSSLESLDWQAVTYPAAGSVFYVGGPFQCLRKYAFDPDTKVIWGRISAPSLGELAGPRRDITNWLTPSAVLDAALFTSGILAWNSIRPGVTLPQRLKQISFYRIPRPAEICWVRSRIVEIDHGEATFDITVWGSDNEPLLVVEHYVAAWLPSLRAKVSHV